MIKENLERVRERIAEAARSAGRDSSDVRLICATKGVSAERIREAIDCGVREIGENRVQEAQEKRHALSGAGGSLRWHLIGSLQRNKAAPAAQLFDAVHSVDSLELIEALEKQMAKREPFILRQAQDERKLEQTTEERPGTGNRLEVLIQVNVSGEATKRGCRPEQARGLAEAVLKAKHLQWTGLMTMAPYSENPEDSRPHFRRLRELRDELGRALSGAGLIQADFSPELSMGMSGDFEPAVREGATMVRVGTAIFGERSA